MKMYRLEYRSGLTGKWQRSSASLYDSRCKANKICKQLNEQTPGWMVYRVVPV